MTDTAAHRYLLLGLRLGRHLEGIVDAYFGPPELAAAVEAAPPPEPRTLVADADALLDELEDGWLRDQVVGLRTFAGVLAGETYSYADEVEGCYGVRPAYTDEAVIGAAHERLEELLPGAGSIAERYERWRESMRVPKQQIEPTVAAVIERARAWTGELVELPPGEGIELAIVHDQPWLAYNFYQGGLRSRIEINADLPMSAISLLHLAIHEAYPGHHAERACKDQLLVRGRGLLEESIVLVPAPQSLVSEGIAELGTSMLLESEIGEQLAEIVRAAGMPLDLAHAVAVERADDPLRKAEVNAALMLHEGAGEAEARAYLERWALRSPELSAHLIRFLKEPTSRTYLITYSAGHELCGSWVAGDRNRFRRLLTEQVRVGELLQAPDA